MSELHPVAFVVRDALQEMFAGIEAFADFKLQRMAESNEMRSSVELATVLGYNGEQMKGSIVVACDQQLLDASHPNHALGMPVQQLDLIDWSGEIANQMLGRVKNKLTKSGVSFALSTPTTMTGKQMEIRRPRDGHAVEFDYKGARGSILVHFLAVLAAGVTIRDGAQSDVASEGASLLF